MLDRKKPIIKKKGEKAAKKPAPKKEPETKEVTESEESKPAAAVPEGAVKASDESESTPQTEGGT